MCSNSFWILEAQFWVKTVIRSNGCQCNCKDEVLRAEFGENDEQAPAESHASADGVAAIGAEAWESQACYGVNFENRQICCKMCLAELLMKSPEEVKPEVRHRNVEHVENETYPHRRKT